MVRDLTNRESYTLGTRVIAGTHEEKLEQIEDEIQRLLKIKAFECGDTNTTFLVAPRGSHWFAMTVTILVLLVVLVVLLTAHTAQAQTEPAPPAPAPAATDDRAWKNVRSGATLERDRPVPARRDPDPRAQVGGCVLDSRRISPRLVERTVLSWSPGLG